MVFGTTRGAQNLFDKELARLRVKRDLMKTTLATISDVANKKWWLFDADDVPLGRLAVRIANILRGKDRPLYTAHMDAGDFVIVINAEKVKLTGDKDKKKEYMFYSGYLGGEKHVPAFRMLEKNPIFVIEHAVRGMLQKNRLSEQLMRKLKVYAGSEHPHEAQQPTLVTVDIRAGRN